MSHMHTHRPRRIIPTNIILLIRLITRRTIHHRQAGRRHRSTTLQQRDHHHHHHRRIMHGQGRSRRTKGILTRPPRISIRIRICTSRRIRITRTVQERVAVGHPP